LWNDKGIKKTAENNKEKTLTNNNISVRPDNHPVASDL
jgi:hypothetical protein